MNDYKAKQSVKNARYKSAYSEWIGSLSADERRQLAASGLDQPLVDDQPASGCGLSEDIADSPVASTPLERPSREPEKQAPASRLDDESVWDIIRRLMGEILSMPNRSLTVDCIALVSGLSYVGDSMADIARRHRVTRAAVSKRCIEMTERLCLPPSHAMRSLTARKSYRDAQLRVQADNETQLCSPPKPKK